MNDLGNFYIRAGVLQDIDEVQLLARKNSKALGFVRRASLEEAIQRRGLWVAFVNLEVVGFITFRKRRDLVSTVYELCVAEAYRNQGIGRLLLKTSTVPIVLKCPQDLPANEFYQRAGFVLERTEKGRNRSLNVWKLS